MLYASIPTDDIAIGTVQIRPKAGTYTSTLELDAGTTYFLRATGEAYSTTATVNNEPGRSYDGDIEFAASSTVTTWGVATTAGNVSTAASAWGATQSDHVYEQRVTPKSAGALNFTFANDGTVAVSTLAVTVYAPVPMVSVGMIRTDRVVGSVAVNALPDGVATVPVNDADFDQNGVPDNQQSGRVPKDGFLLPITLPAVASAATLDHYKITVPKAFRVWQNADRTGSTAGIGLREGTAHTVYLEVRSELPRGTTADVSISEVYDGATITQQVPISTFQFTGSTTVTTGKKATYGSDATRGEWDSAIGGSADTAAVSTSKTTQYVNVLWGDTPIDGYVDYRVNSDFIWGLPVIVD